MTSPISIDISLFERILQTTVSASSIDELCRKHNVKVGRGIYSLAVVVWLMLYQRLNSKRTLSSAVHFLARQRFTGSKGARLANVFARAGSRPELVAIARRDSKCPHWLPVAWPTTYLNNSRR
jgi:hypothetical protein